MAKTETRLTIAIFPVIERGKPMWRVEFREHQTHPNRLSHFAVALFQTRPEAMRHTQFIAKNCPRAELFA
jgi:hypothetical protein